MTPAPILTRCAQDDLELVWGWTAERFGVAQADRYLDRLYDAIRRCAIAPQAGRALDDVRAGYRAVVVGSHLVVYTSDEHGVVVRRVLHGRMDLDEHLDDDDLV